MMAALSFILFLASSIPLLGAFAVLMCPIPLTFVAVRHGARRAALATTCASILVLLVGGGPAQAMIFLAGFGSFGLATGWMVTRNGPPGRTLIVASVAVGFVLLLSTLATSKAMGIDDSMAELKTMTFTMLDQQAKMINDPTFASMIVRYKALIITLLVCPIGIFFMGAVINLYINYVITYRVLLRMGVTVQPPGNAYHLRLPAWLTCLMAVAFVRYNNPALAANSIQASVLANFLMVSGMTAWLGGIAALARMVSPKKETSAAMFIGLSLGGFIFGGMPVLLGLFDSFSPPAPPAEAPPAEPTVNPAA